MKNVFLFIVSIFFLTYCGPVNTPGEIQGQSGSRVIQLTARTPPQIGSDALYDLVGAYQDVGSCTVTLQVHEGQQETSAYTKKNKAGMGIAGTNTFAAATVHFPIQRINIQSISIGSGCGSTTPVLSNHGKIELSGLSLKTASTFSLIMDHRYYSSGNLMITLNSKNAFYTVYWYSGYTSEYSGLDGWEITLSQFNKNNTDFELTLALGKLHGKYIGVLKLVRDGMIGLTGKRMIGMWYMD